MVHGSISAHDQFQSPMITHEARRNIISWSREILLAMDSSASNFSSSPISFTILPLGPYSKVSLDSLHLFDPVFSPIPFIPLPPAPPIPAPPAAESAMDRRRTMTASFFQPA